MPTLPTPNKTPGDGAPAGDINLVIEAISSLASEVDNIPAGPQGPQGEPGVPGVNGQAATITVDSTTTTAPGANAAVIQSGTAQNASLAFFIPRGEQGPQGPQGLTGAIGPAGAAGATGAPGAGVKPGGFANQVLSKNSDNDFDTVWVFPGSAPVTSVDGRQGDVTLDDLYDPAGAAASAQSSAEGYADGLAVNYDAAGSAVAAQSAAELYADGLAVNYDPAGSASSAQSAAESYADGVASAAQSAAESYADGLAVNYDPVGSASAAQSAAESYADGLAVNYDPVGSASAAQAAAESYADGLAVNYDAAGSASAVAGDLSTHELLTTSVHGISDTADLVYTTDSRLTDDRYPTVHATSHESGGGDELELAPSQVTGTAVVADDVHLITFCTSTTRPVSPVEGQIIYETDTDTYFGWKGSSWLPIGGGATGGGTDDVFYENSQTVTTSYTLTTDKNAMSAGPVEIDDGATVTVPAGQVWVVV
jgi:hypothetical protein